MKISKSIVNFIFIVLALVFLTSGALKLIEFQSFKESVYSYDIFSEFTTNIVVVGILLLELLIALSMLLGIWPKMGLMSLIFLLLFMNAFTFYSVIGNKHWVCQCFGEIFANEINFLTILRNIALLTLSVLVFFLKTEYYSFENKLERYYFPIILGIVLFGIYFSFYHKDNPTEKRDLRTDDTISNFKFLPINRKDTINTSKRKEPFLVLVFFDVSDCTPCLLESYLWRNLFENYQNEVMIVGIGSAPSVDVLRIFLKNKKLNFPVMYDMKKKIIQSYSFITPQRILLNTKNKILDFERSTDSLVKQKRFIEKLESAIENYKKISCLEKK
jgi:peroxiredoxin/uncharacterized membrane protein YphA (DoxX/SURF4 family)